MWTANKNVYYMDKQKVALVLSMGGARGIAHIGVIEELLRHNFEITSIAGSSMGAMVGAMYASGKLEECKEWLYSWDKRKMWELADLTLSRDGLVKGDRFIKELKQIIPVMNIEELPIPYVAMATDIVCDQEVRFDSGNLYDAIRATISIPMLFRPLRKDGMVLIDGGILNPLPLNQVHRTEGDILIAVDVNAPIDCGKKKKMSPYNLLTESSRMMMQQITRYQIERCQPDILIQMSGNAYDMLEFHHAASIVETGIEITRDALNTELSEVTDAIADFVCDTLGVTKEELASLKAEAMPQLLKQAVDTLQAASQTDTMAADKDALNQTGTVENTMTAIAEDANSSNLQKDSQQDMSMRDDSEMLQGDDSLVPTHATMAETFTDRLSQALEKSSGMKGQSVTQTMNQIVEQVVRQVRIRVMPETTSMELRLNPASLGRVNITVAASAGIATATMVVENQMAKEALESQMIHLKEAFNEQGLKVDEVEVTVAEFGLKKDGEGQEQTGSKQSGNRKFRPNESFSDEEKNEDLTTASERRGVNSMVDYTA